MNSSETNKPDLLNTAAGKSTTSTKEGPSKSNTIDIPSITLPKGGGAIKNIDEKFSVNAANDTFGFSIPFPFSPSRNGFMPAIELSYNSGSGNSIFGLGWNAEPHSITRKTDKKLPEYIDANITIVDLLDNRIGCIVWSSPLPNHTANPLRFID